MISSRWRRKNFKYPIQSDSYNSKTNISGVEVNMSLLEIKLNDEQVRWVSTKYLILQVLSYLTSENNLKTSKQARMDSA